MTEWIIIAAAMISLGVSLLLFLIDDASWDSGTGGNFGAILGAIGCGLAGVVLLGMSIGVPISRHITHNNCKKYARYTGREVKFVEYNYWSYQCLTRSHDGTWIPTTQVRDVSQ